MVSKEETYIFLTEERERERAIMETRKNRIEERTVYFFTGLKLSFVAVESTHTGAGNRRRMEASSLREDDYRSRSFFPRPLSKQSASIALVDD